MIRSAGKRFYTFSIGKLNAAKLANFLDIDVFVLVACPENSLIDSKEFLRPILTPFELLLSLQNSSDFLFESGWSSNFSLFLETRKQQKKSDDILLKKEDEDVPRYSLATGKLVRTKYYIDENILSNRKEGLPLRIAYEPVDMSASERLATRFYQGLVPLDEAQEGKIGPIIEGSAGTARGYSYEKNHS